MKTPAFSGPIRRVVSADEIAAYRNIVRIGSGGATAQASPVYPFVLAHTVAEDTVRALGADEATPPAVVHLGQDIRIERAVRPGEHVRVQVEVVGIRREARGVRAGLRTMLAGVDGTARAELITHVLLVGASAIRPSGELPPVAPPPPGTEGEPATVTHRLTSDWTGRYAEVAGDRNPIHLDVAAARAAGFDTTLVHGMGVVAVVCEEIIGRYAAADATRVRSIACRFSAPVLAGEQLRCTLRPHTSGDVVRFDCHTAHGVAIKQGWARIAPSTGHEGSATDA